MITIYAEYLFIENFIINYIILFLTCKIYGVNLKRKVLIISSTVCALYSFVFFIPNMGYLYSGIAKILFSAALIKLTFFRLKPRQLLKVLVIFYIVSFVLGGLVLALIYFTKMDGMVSSNIFYIGNISYLQIFSSVIAGYILVACFINFFKNRMIKDRSIRDLYIEIEGKNTIIKGLLDTGNFLRDPISQDPVFIAEWDAIKSILPDGFNDFFSKSINFENIQDKIYETGFASKIKMIPYTTLGTKNGMLMGIKANKVIVMKEGESVILQNVIIALYDGKFNKDREYSALLHPDILKEEAISND